MCFFRWLAELKDFLHSAHSYRFLSKWEIIWLLRAWSVVVEKSHCVHLTWISSSWVNMSIFTWLNDVLHWGRLCNNFVTQFRFSFLATFAFFKDKFTNIYIHFLLPTQYRASAQWFSSYLCCLNLKDNYLLTCLHPAGCDIWKNYKRVPEYIHIYVKFRPNILPPKVVDAVFKIQLLPPSSSSCRLKFASLLSALSSSPPLSSSMSIPTLAGRVFLIHFIGPSLLYYVPSLLDGYNYIPYPEIFPLPIHHFLITYIGNLILGQ